MEVNFFFQLRYRSLGLHCFSGVIVRQIIPWSFFFLQRFEVTGVLVTIKTGLKCSSGDINLKQSCSDALLLSHLICPISLNAAKYGLVLVERPSDANATKFFLPLSFLDKYWQRHIREGRAFPYKGLIKVYLLLNKVYSRDSLPQSGLF